jgi:hypothetical protein
MQFIGVQEGAAGHCFTKFAPVDGNERVGADVVTADVGALVGGLVGFELSS